MYQDAPKEKALSLFRLRAYLLVRLAGIEPTTPWFVARRNQTYPCKNNDLRCPHPVALHQAAGACVTNLRKSHAAIMGHAPGP